jgi:hypothetical protein
MLELADSYSWTDKAAIIAASILGAILLFGAFQALRFRFSRRYRGEAHSDADTTLVYPQESPLVLLPFFAFNALVVFLALYVSWPLWLRLLVALPFLFMGGICCFIGFVVVRQRFRRRSSDSSAHEL